MRWCPAYKAADKMSKDFLNTIPLISLLAAKSMMERHWNALKTVTKKDFTPPYASPEMQLSRFIHVLFVLLLMCVRQVISCN